MMRRPFLKLRDVLLFLLLGSAILNFALIHQLNKVPLVQQRTVMVQNSVPKRIYFDISWQANALNGTKNHEIKSYGNGALTCKQHGGPSPEAVSDIVYWRDDVAVEKQFHTIYGDGGANASAEEKYLVFEPDEAGFSNVRLSFETVVAMAKAMGRTLVLPPSTRFTQLRDGEFMRSYDYLDFFHISGVRVMSFEDYLKRVAVTGTLRNSNGEVTYPPDNRVDWNGRIGNSPSAGKGEGDKLWNWVGQAMPAIDWKRSECVVAFPSRNDEDHLDAIQAAMDTVLKDDGNSSDQYQYRILEYNGKPTPVNSTTFLRLREMMAERKRLCQYNDTYEKATSLFMTGQESTGSRPLIQFYAYLFFQDWQQDLQMKRYIRDNLRFSDEIQCAAARVVEAIRQIARSASNSTDDDGGFDSMHVRRSDFMTLPTYRDGTPTAQNIVDQNFFAEQRTLYIATDEKDKTFFEPLRSHYNVLYLEDFAHLLQEVNDPNTFGMIEQLITAKGDKFVGTYFSTFSAYVNRIRGYHAQKSRTRGFMSGSLNSEYMGHKGTYRYALNIYNSVRDQYWIREWPVGWRDIDHDVDDMVEVGLIPGKKGAGEREGGSPVLKVKKK